MISNKRRQLLRISAETIILAPAIASINAFAWANSRDQILRIMLPALPYFDLVKKHLQQFSNSTGTNIHIDVFPYLDMRNIQLKELQQKQGMYDLIIMLAAWKTEYVEMNLLSNLDIEQNNGRLKIDDVNDFVPAYLTVAGKVGEQKDIWMDHVRIYMHCHLEQKPAS